MIGDWRKLTKSAERETWRPKRSGSEPGEAADKMQTMSASLPKPGHRKRKKAAMTVKMQSLDKSKNDPGKKGHRGRCCELHHQHRLAHCLKQQKLAS